MGFQFGGLGRNRTIDTRIFKTANVLGVATSNSKNSNEFFGHFGVSQKIFRTEYRTVATSPTRSP